MYSNKIYKLSDKIKEYILKNKMFFVIISALIIYRLIISTILKSYTLTADSYEYINYSWSALFEFKIDVSGRNPVYPAFIDIIEAITAIFGVDYLIFIPIAQHIISLISIFYLYEMLVILTKNKKVACFISLIFGMDSQIITWHNSILTESLSISLTVILLYLLAKYLQTPNLKTANQTIFLALIMTFLKSTFVVFSLGIPCFFIIRMFTNKEETAILKKVFISCGLSFLAIGVYLLLFNNTFGYYSLSNAMPRQNVVISIENEYYKNSSDEEFIKIIDENLEEGLDVWANTAEILQTYGLFESNRLAKETFNYDLTGFIKDRLNLLFGQADAIFSLSYFWYNTQDEIALNYDINTYNAYNYLYKFMSMLLSPFTAVYALILSIYEFIYSIYILIKKKDIPWIHLGLFIALVFIPVSTYFVTCSDYGRTMSYVLPFIYLSIGLIIGNLFKPCKSL